MNSAAAAFAFSLALAPLLCAAPAAQADEKQAFQALLAEKQAALVTVKFVLKVRSRFGERENDREITGVMVAPDGLTLCANSQLAGFWGQRSDVTATPTDIKVLIGDDLEGVGARLVARDSELDLAWLRVDAPERAPLAFVDFSHGAAPEVGDALFTIDRLAKYFDRAPIVRTTRVGAVTSKPRKMYVPTASLGALGLPVYDDAGAVVGVSIALRPDEDEDGGDGSQGWGMILPAGEVAKATRRARDAAQSEDGD